MLLPFCLSINNINDHSGNVLLCSSLIFRLTISVFSSILFLWIIQGRYYFHFTNGVIENSTNYVIYLRTQCWLVVELQTSWLLGILLLRSPPGKFQDLQPSLGATIADVTPRIDLEVCPDDRDLLSRGSNKEYNFMVFPENPYILGTPRVTQGMKTPNKRRVLPSSPLPPFLKANLITYSVWNHCGGGRPAGFSSV